MIMASPGALFFDHIQIIVGVVLASEVSASLVDTLFVFVATLMSPDAGRMALEAGRGGRKGAALISRRLSWSAGQHVGRSSNEKLSSDNDCSLRG
jgi:hypothetical protein